MMKLKPFLKNLGNPALLFSLLTFLSILGCRPNFEPNYKEKDISSLIQKFCKEEYNLEVTTQVVGKTLWVYLPVDKILHKDYPKTQDNIFDENVDKKLRDVMMMIGRVILNADQTPQFYCVVTSDIKEIGLDYFIMGNVLDMKKSYAGSLPWEEANKRYVIKLEGAPQALGDTTGTHIKPYDITQIEFLANQMAQRIEVRLRGKDLKNLYEVKSVKPDSHNNSFIFYIDIKKIDPTANVDITKEAFKIISSVLRDYDFYDFIEVNVNETAGGKNIIVSQKTLFEDF